MKTVKCFLLLLLSITISCNNDTDDLSTTNNSVLSNITNDVKNLVPCEFDFSIYSSNDEILINCNYDLNGQTITFPENITLKYDGGLLTNGTIILNGGHIDGKLLNIDLEVEGSARLISTDFVFEKEKWNITEGQVSDEIALTNRENLNKAISLVKSLRGYEFQINDLDAYFQVRAQRDNGNYIVTIHHVHPSSIRIPSNFHLKMAEETHLRVQPNNTPHYALLTLYNVDNSIVSGGNLTGDRYTHQYISGTGANTHEWGHLIYFVGAHNSVIDGVNIKEGTGDGIEIRGTEHRNNDGSLKSHGRETYNVTIKNCIIDDNRRDNISVTDGTNIFIEYNTILNAGSGDSNSDVSSNGTSPRTGIQIESYKHNAPDNNSVYDLQLVTNLHIRNNTFNYSYGNDLVLYNGETIYVYENTFKSKRAIGTQYSFNNKIYNNLFERDEGLMGGSIAINLVTKYWENGEYRVKDYEITNNTFTGYKLGIVTGGQGHKVKNNTLTDNQRGILLVNSKNLEFDNNIITSNVVNSSGYETFSSEVTIKNCLIKNGETNVDAKGLNISYMNNSEPGDITIENVDFNGDIRLNTTQNITIMNSTYENIIIIDCEPILINNN